MSAGWRGVTHPCFSSLSQHTVFTACRTRQENVMSRVPCCRWERLHVFTSVAESTSTVFAFTASITCILVLGQQGTVTPEMFAKKTENDQAPAGKSVNCGHNIDIICAQNEYFFSHEISICSLIIAWGSLLTSATHCNKVINRSLIK